MRIAIVAPCPVPYVIGGAEKLWWGLVRHLNECTAHQADVIKLPSPEADFPSLMQSYEAFSKLALDGFDCVISTKYPAWLVRHPNHVVYMQHRLRGVYDSYPTDLPVDPPASNHPLIAALLEVIAQFPGERGALQEVFDRWREMKADESLVAQFALPGPLSRAIVHFMDGVGLNPREIRRYSAIAHTVTARADYFPGEETVHVAHHPSNLALSRGEGAAYLFTASRLDTPKRVGLIVEAMRHVRAGVPLWIAGTGTEESALRTLARSDARVRFLGFVSDGELAELYRNAIAVPFVPYQEDYGLITVEAMMAGKPVITSTDAGGPTEIVRDGQTGFIVSPRPDEIGAALQRVIANPELARRLGDAGRLIAERITWDHVVRTVLGETDGASTPAELRTCKPKLVVATTFPIWPPRYGGPSRVYHLYRELARHFEVVVVSLTEPPDEALDREITPGMREVRIPKSYVHVAKEAAASARLGIPVSDIMAPQLVHETPRYREALAREVQNADVLVACHPYLFPLLEELRGDRQLWYEAQDVETRLKTEVLPDRPEKASVLQAVEQIERACCTAAALVLPCSSDDAAILERDFSVPAEKIVVVWNGTDVARISFVARAEREGNKAKLGVRAPMVLFMGSGHHPNIDAAHQILAIARELREARFLLLGHVAYAFLPSDVPDNVWLIGEASDVARDLVLQTVDVAINPLRFGSGTSLKMLDYFAAGVPVISSDVGARGLPVQDESHLLIRPIDDFGRAIRDILEKPHSYERLCRNARDLVEREFDWRVIADQVLDRIIPAEARSAARQ